MKDAEKSAGNVIWARVTYSGLFIKYFELSIFTIFLFPNRYSRDFDDYDAMNASTKSHDEMDKAEITTKNIRADSGDVEILTELE